MTNYERVSLSISIVAGTVALVAMALAFVPPKCGTDTPADHARDL